MSSDNGKKHYHVLPVRDMVIFPGIIAPLFVGRPRSLKAIELSMLQDRVILVVAQKDMQLEDPDTADLFNVGTLCNILQMVRIPDGTTKVLIEGLERVRIEQFIKGKEILEADAISIQREVFITENLEALKRSVLELFEKYVTLHPKIPSEVLISAMNIDDPAQLADLVASHLTIKIREKQKLLEQFDPELLLKHLLKVLIEEIDILELEHDIQDKVRKELERGHKEYYLREQLKIIQDELGQGESTSELDELREKIDSAGMPEDTHHRALHELERLSKMPAMSAEATVVRTYIDWLVSLPWNRHSTDRLDINYARSVLEEDHYGLEKVKERILEYLAVRIRALDHMRGQVLCFVGPPGVGKTSLARSIARALDRKFVNMSLGGMRDEAEIRGHRKTYVGSLPGRIIQKIRQAGTNNPVMLMDEIDKMGMDFRGDPSAALLEVLDAEQNHSFTDHFLEVPFDLSKVIFITTANVTHTIPKPLLDRMEVIHIPGYVAEEKAHITKRHLLPKILTEHGLSRKDIRISPLAIDAIIREYTREAGVRNLERQLSMVCRKVTRKIVETSTTGEELPLPVSVGKTRLKEYLGPPKLYNLRLPSENKQGVAVGLAWTESGGDVLVIEAATMKGKGSITLTGNLGDIMQESAQTALGYLKANAYVLELEKIKWDSIDIHLHVPEGAIPKDGPSAGITMALAILSALRGSPISSDIAMTGEVSLLGDVLPVGGIREKILAARRNNIQKVILPRSNKQDLEELPHWAVDGMQFYFVNNVSEVFDLALKENR
ncbi:MAG: endopeptidase La [Synergistales bacterium]|nr:endopeptidase La [Synergistales bacterium]